MPGVDVPAPTLVDNFTVHDTDSGPSTNNRATAAWLVAPHAPSVGSALSVFSTTSSTSASHTLLLGLSEAVKRSFIASESWRTLSSAKVLVVHAFAFGVVSSVLQCAPPSFDTSTRSTSSVAVPSWSAYQRA